MCNIRVHIQISTYIYLYIQTDKLVDRYRYIYIVYACIFKYTYLSVDNNIMDIYPVGNQ